MVVDCDGVLGSLMFTTFSTRTVTSRTGRSYVEEGGLVILSLCYTAWARSCGGKGFLELCR